MESDFELAKTELMDEQVQEDSNHGSKDIISFDEALERELEFQRSKKVRLLMPSVDTRSVPASQFYVGSGFVSASPHGAERDLNMGSPPHPFVKAKPCCQNPFERVLEYGKSMEMRAKPDCQKPFERRLEYGKSMEMGAKPDWGLECIKSVEMKAKPYFQKPFKRGSEYGKSIEMKSVQPAIASGLVTTSQELPLMPDFGGVKRSRDSLSYPQKNGNHDNRILPGRALQPQKSLDSQASLHQLQYHKRPSQVGSQRFQSQGFPPQQMTYPQQAGTQHASNKTVTEPLLCSLCNVQCVNAVCLQQHCEGKKHKAKQEEVSGCKSDEKKWCPQCKIWCMNEFSLAQHLLGKKHASCTMHGRVEVLTGKSDGMRWCPKCEIWCMDEHALAQHRAGKKHAACLRLHRAIKSNIRMANIL